MTKKQKITWKTEKVKIKDLKPAKYNPRKISKYQMRNLQDSITEYGMAEDIAVNTDLTVIGGHQRLKALKKLGIDEVTVKVPERSLSELECKDLNIRLNGITGEWLISERDDLLKELEDNDFDIMKLGLYEDEVPDHLKPVVEDEAPIPEKKAVSKVGELYQLGRHRIMCGDSTDKESVKKLLHKKKPVLMVTDPPYGVNYNPMWRNDICRLKNKKYGCRATGKVENDDRINWSETYKLYDVDVIYIWHAGIHAGEVANNLTKCGYNIIAQIVWVKPHFTLSRGDYHWKHEPCYYAVKIGAKHNWQGSRKENTVWEIKGTNPFGHSTNPLDEFTGHGTQKPIECMMRPIKNNTSKNDIVVDPFLGSGSTLMACEQSNRICYGMEIDPHYVDVVIKRWENFTGEKAKKLK